MTEMQQKDLVLSINEYAYVLDETKGHVSCLVGPTKMSLSQSDKLVLFDPMSKSFIPCPSMDRAKQLFTTIPENWYAILKNPVEGNKHPTPGASNGLPENVHVGKKINITGPDNFALYPGQMAKVIKGHALRSNQYLLARVYEANSANASQGKVFDADGKEIANTITNCVNGQILVIKGTEISFYIPPTGIEVIPVDKGHKTFVRDAITLERLEYCILKDENGSKRYVHGPQVVFPAPTETFITSTNGSAIFKAIELSPISGIYVKVIADYEEDGVSHKAGEELFITGNDQMIYYPRPEHAIINYDGKVVHHSIAIPKGEGRYIMDRLTGEIKTVRGPAMYLPDPRTEVVVKRKLTRRQVELWYPGNAEAIAYNESLTEKKVEKATAKAMSFTDALNASYSITASDTYNTTTSCSLVTDPFCLDQLESKASISRGTSYTKPRTITLDNKFDGVVTIDVWNGYAVNIISKDGSRETVCGPQTIVLDYDQTLETITVNNFRTVFLPIANNKVSIYVGAETQDQANVEFNVSFNVDFDLDFVDYWFNCNDFESILGATTRNVCERLVGKCDIVDFYNNYQTILAEIKDIINDQLTEKYGFMITDSSISEFDVEETIADFFENERVAAVRRSIECSTADARLEAEKYLAEQEIKELEEANRKMEAKIRLQAEIKEKQIESNRHVEEMNEAAAYAKKQAESALQALIDEISAAELARKDREIQQQIEHTKAAAKIEAEKQKNYADMVKEIISAIGPDLAAALSHKANSKMLETVSSAVAPYALAQGESLADVVNKMVRGTSLENVIDGANININ